MTTRRTVLAAAGGIAAAIGISSAGHAATGGDPVPRTLARKGAEGDAGARMSRTPFPLTHLGIAWSGTGAPPVRILYPAGWTSWRRPLTSACCGGSRDDTVTPARSSLLTVPGAIGYEVAAADSVAGVSVTELNTVDGPTRATAGSAAQELRVNGRSAPLRYADRAAWGADESLRFDVSGAELWTPEYFPVQALTVHHTATANDDPDPAATVRAIYYYHAVTQGWGDVGYHLLIDEAGTVYEGRYSGADRRPVFGPGQGPAGHPEMVNAGHVGGYNAGNVGVALLGDLTDRSATRAARRSLTLVLTLLAGVEGLDPLSSVGYVNPISGASRTVDVISAHRDWQPTECPGNTFYPQLPSVRRDVARLLR